MADSTTRQFEPIPKKLRSRFRFDLERNLYASEEAWHGDLDRAETLAEGIASFKERVIETSGNLLSVLRGLDDLSILLSKTYTYALLRFAIDTKDDGPYQEIQRRYSEIASIVAFADLEVMEISEPALSAFETEKPELAAYRFAVEENRRRKPHTLSTEEETLLSYLEEDLTGWQRLLFQTCLNRTRFRDIVLPEGKVENVWLDRLLLATHDDRTVRDDAFHWLYEDYASHNDVMVFALIRRIKTANKLARLRRYDDSPHERFFTMHLTTGQVDNVLSQIEGHAEIFKKFHALRKRHIASFSGIEKVEPWDMRLVPPDFERPRVDILRSTEILTDALSFHGDEYLDELRSLFDLANGRLDLVKGKGRRPGAFATGYYGAPWQFFSEGYNGLIDDLMTLAHETGHAIHYKLVSNAKVPPVYYRGPGYFTESFAMMNEMVTGRYLVDHSASREEKRYYLQEFLGLLLRMFDVNMRCSFELTCYRGVDDGTLHGPDDFNKLGVELGTKYNDEFAEHPELMYNWSRTHHFWTVPLYYFNYLFSSILSIEYFRRHLDDPGFDGTYVALMRNGFDRPPADLLKEFLGLDLEDPALMQGTFAYLEQLLEELAGVYAES